MEPTRHDITQLLEQAGQGGREAWDRLTPLIYDELRKIAAAAMRRERAGHTLQPTALVHEAFVRLVGSEQAAWNNRAHFFGAAAQTIRRLLIEHARRRNAAKRSGGRAAEPIDDLVVSFEERSADIVELDGALTRLAEHDAQQARIVELRFFGGLTVAETAAAMDISPSTVERGWRFARAWLLGELERSGKGPRSG